MQEKQLRKELENQKLEAKQLGISSFELESLKQKVAQIDKLAESLSSEVQRLEIELQAPSRITSHRKAEVPVAPDMGKKYKVAGFAGLGVFSLIAGGIVWLEYHARRISSLDEVLDGLSLRVVGCLALRPRWLDSEKSNSHSGRREVWQSIWTESIDAARTMLIRNASTDSIRTVMVCSATGGEGKTTLFCHLATSLARAGRKTVLVDTDVRRPSVHPTLDVPLTPGFCELLRGEAELEDVIHTASPEGLFVIPAGKIDREALSLLAQDRAAPMFEQLREEFNFAIVDSAPVLPVTDSLLIGQYVDGVLFSIRRDISRFGKVAAACRRMSMLGIPVIGTVVTGLDETSYGYGNSYRYYGFGGYGGYGAYGTYAYHTHPKLSGGRLV